MLNWLCLPLRVGLALGVAWVAPGPRELRVGLSRFVLIAGLWLTQALPLAVAALAEALLALVQQAPRVLRVLGELAFVVLVIGACATWGWP